MTTTSAKLERMRWDVIVIGTGMGGATLGYALAKQGKRVLFCEKGKSLLASDQGLRGDFAETFFEHAHAPSPRDRDCLLEAGRFAEEIVDTSGNRPRRYVPFVGTGTGGSSAIYGAALERFFPQDFRPRENHKRSANSTLPAEWPISYEDLRPYYEAAEILYRVRGSEDPCSANNGSRQLLPPPAMSPPAQEFFHFLEAKELHPYQLPQACEYVVGCTGCQGFLCGRDCKNDATRVCLLPAIKEHGAELLDDCAVVGLEASRRDVAAAVCTRGGETVKLRADIFVLAAGALETPRVLLNSVSGDWPRGLANDSGLVGKNLMRHFVDLFAVQPSARDGHPGNRKEIAFNDFYFTDGQKLGTVQSFGALPPASVVVAALEKDLRDGQFSWTVPLFRAIKPGAKYFLKSMLDRRILFATIMEDLPYDDNSVSLDQAMNTRARGQIRIDYRIRDYDRGRIDMFRARVRDTFRPYRMTILKQAENNERLAHACGTCRFGSDPRNSVLDRNNRCHNLNNLYIADASFFPSSGGTNPGLTIAANALRVAKRMAAEPRL